MKNIEKNLDKAATKMQKEGNLRAFRASQDVETFYRFVHESMMRHEAKVLLDTVFKRLKKKNKKSSRAIQ